MGLTFLLSAGGTGGHLFPAQALASELTRRGHDVELATDHRVGEIGQDFPARRTHVIASATLAGKSPVALARTAWKLGCGTLQARSLLRSLKPDAVVGFGGYPTFPPMLAAWLTGTPSVLHEANAVMAAPTVCWPRVQAPSRQVSRWRQDRIRRLPPEWCGPEIRCVTP